ncbi:SH3 domain-containing protein [Acutalibacter caecimuris]|uniref:SH3 domain-containing protein n=1 Tax=Acutalibacter caecimuris TaxID=3093657 RepID=UPI002AC9E3FE|nr:SH3 domain-containing protein [Acutalibacter sp. M00118]
MKKNGRNSGRESRLTIKTVGRGLAALMAGCLLAGALSACGGDNKDNSSGTGSGLASIAPIATAAPTPAATAKAAKVTADVLNVRESPSTDGEWLGSVEEGDRLALLADSPQNGWYNVQFEGVPAYVSAEFVEVVEITVEQYQQLMATPAPTATPAPETGTSPAPGDSPSPAATPIPGSEEDGE